jgi:hypothetical protein
MGLRSRIFFAAAIALAVLACKKPDGATTGDAGSDKPGAASASTSTSTASGAFGADIVTVEWTGKFADVNADKQLRRQRQVGRRREGARARSAAYEVRDRVTATAWRDAILLARFLRLPAERHVRPQKR